jgi:hypothetical protein
MASGRFTSAYRRVPKWKMLQNILEESSREAFPNENEYPASHWASWERRIRDGEKFEEKAISRRAREISRRSGNAIDISDHVEDIQHTRHVSVTMYGALFVALWAKMEDCLNAVVRVGRMAKSEHHKKDYKFRELKTELEKLIDKKLTDCHDFKMVDAIRILNNSFKHDDGRYKPLSGKDYTQIDEKLLLAWGMEKSEQISFGKLPIRDLAIACNAFLSDLWKKANSKIPTSPPSNLSA